jgi:hypothetical protein
MFVGVPFLQSPSFLAGVETQNETLIWLSVSRDEVQEEVSFPLSSEGVESGI